MTEWRRGSYWHSQCFESKSESPEVDSPATQTHPQALILCSKRLVHRSSGLQQSYGPNTMADRPGAQCWELCKPLSTLPLAMGHGWDIHGLDIRMAHSSTSHSSLRFNGPLPPPIGTCLDHALQAYSPFTCFMSIVCWIYCPTLHKWCPVSLPGISVPGAERSFIHSCSSRVKC